jgi:hypothetical protein
MKDTAFVPFTVRGSRCYGVSRRTHGALIVIG